MNFRFKFSVLIISLFILFSCSSTRTISNNKENSRGFSNKETELILELDDSNPMRVLTVDNPIDSVILNTESQVVLVDNSSTLKKFVKRLYSTVTDSASLGVGIAAPQVGILRKIIWVQRFDKEGNPFDVYLNPRIIQYSKKKQSQMEGCLSVPNRYDTLNIRAYTVLIEYDKMNGTHVIEMVEGFTAVIFQHEIDHLFGIIYTEYIDN